MARFILDVANLTPQQITQLQVEILEKTLAGNGVTTINCIDESNDNQFHNEFDNGQTNELSTAQINNFKNVCNNV